jgi:phage terminase large subunit-like protein
MLLDNDGDAVFIYTPPSLHSRSRTKARDSRHAAKLYKRAKEDDSGRWEAFHFTSHDNPHINKDALEEITGDMTSLAYQQEILADDLDSDPRALWNFHMIEDSYIESIRRDYLVRIVVAIDPAMTATDESNQTGIVVCGVDGNGIGYVLEDLTLTGSPAQWATCAIDAYDRWGADRIVAETNNGGDMVEHTIRTVDSTVSYKKVHASRGKLTRAEPIAALYEESQVKHVGMFAELEDQLCTYVPGQDSPDRMDALVWAFTELMIKRKSKPPVQQPFIN